jgi:hypothetical protein
MLSSTFVIALDYRTLHVQAYRDLMGGESGGYVRLGRAVQHDGSEIA